MKRSKENLRSNCVGKRQHTIAIARPAIEEDEIDAVTAVLKSGVLAQGKKVEEFEEAFAEFAGTRYAVAVNSATAAVHIALLVHNVKEQDEVITSPFTFTSTANTILYTGAKPVFADIDEETFNIAADSVEQKITPKTKAIMPVHLYGQPCNMKSILKIAVKHRLIVIEDACQAHGAEYDGKKVGSFGTGCFSFYPTKNITTGEGGMITTNDEDIAEKAKVMRNHGQKEKYIQDILGYNYRMTDIAAAIGYCQLKKLEQFNQKRIENAKFLTASLTGIQGLILPFVRSDVKHVFHQYTVRINKDFYLSRDDLQAKLAKIGVATQVYYPLPIHKQPLYKKLGYNDYLPNSEKAAAEVLSLPIYPSLTKEELSYVAESITSCGDLY
jgi:dTDP-4-amino-4,6-dideoxygalactose transaminase